MSSVPFEFLWDFNASAKQGFSGLLGSCGQKINPPGRRLYAVVISVLALDKEIRCWIHQGQLYHGEMETPTFSLLALNYYIKMRDISAVVQCEPSSTCLYEGEMFYHYCVCFKCWEDVEVLQNYLFY